MVFNCVLRSINFVGSKVGQKNTHKTWLISSLLIFCSLFFGIKPAAAHHPLGGEIPYNFLTGFLSGLGHPVIGIDHFAFVVAIGLLCALKPTKGFLLPISLVLATLLGTAVHLLGLDLPIPELIIAASVLVLGVILAIKKQPYLIWLIALVGIAGIFHGYAYGEAIVGAETSPLVAYLVGFSVIQFAIASMAFQLGKWSLKQVTEQPQLYFRFAGFTISGIGFAFLSSNILG